jgi:hypothetical protein
LDQVVNNQQKKVDYIKVQKELKLKELISINIQKEIPKIHKLAKKIKNVLQIVVLLHNH